MAFVVAIDGPSGTGKGTITKLVAQDLNLINIDTGAMYRCVALACLRQEIKTTEQEREIIETAKQVKIQIKHHGAQQEILLNGENVSDEIRKEEVTAFSSITSAIPEVRQILTDLQRKMAQEAEIIMEGRDIGTEVFPNADVKIYLDAKPEERAKRRFLENREKGINQEMSFEEVLKSIEQRDYQDSHRKIGALKVAEGATVIDTTNMTIEEVKEKVKEIILKKRTSRSFI